MMNDELGQRAEDKRKLVVVLIYRLRPPFLAARSAASVAGRGQKAGGDWKWRAVNVHFPRVPHEDLEFFNNVRTMFVGAGGTMSDE